VVTVVTVVAVGVSGDRSKYLPTGDDGGDRGDITVGT
jgi:hypothetical protein